MNDEILLVHNWDRYTKARQKNHANVSASTLSVQVQKSDERVKDKPTNTTEGEELRAMNDKILLTTTNCYTKPAKMPRYLNGEQTKRPGTREWKTNHNTAKTRRKQKTPRSTIEELLFQPGKRPR